MTAPSRPHRQRLSGVTLSLAALLAALLLGAIIWASSATDVVAGLRYLIADRWGVVTLIDVYAGAFVVAVLMKTREPRTRVWLVWVAALIILGHLVSLAFLISYFRKPATADTVAANQSRGPM